MGGDEAQDPAGRRPARDLLSSVGMYRTVEMVFGGIFLVLLALAALGRHPHIPVLRAFRDAFPRLPEEQQARMRRRANTYALH